MTDASTPAITINKVKAIAIPVRDEARATRFYGEILGLPAADAEKGPGAFRLGDAYLLLKTDWHAAPSADPSPRITLEVADAQSTERMLKERGVTISDPAAREGSAYFGSFLDSEGNKFWFCSET